MSEVDKVTIVTRISPTQVLEFQNMCKEHLGIEMSWDKAQIRAVKLLLLMQLTSYPVTEVGLEDTRLLDIAPGLASREVR